VNSTLEVLTQSKSCGEDAKRGGLQKEEEGQRTVSNRPKKRCDAFFIGIGPLRRCKENHGEQGFLFLA